MSEEVTGMDQSFKELVESVRKGTANFELQLSLARGIYPLEPVQQLEILILLLKSRDGKLKQEAVNTLKKMPRSIVLGVSGDPNVPGTLLDGMARLFSKQEEILQTLFVNPALGDKAVAYMATLPYPHLLEMIGRNQTRLDREKEISANLRQNPETPRSIISLFDEADERRRKAEERSREDLEKTAEDEVRLPAVLVDEEPLQDGDGQQVSEATKETVIQVLRSLSAGEKVAMAMKGNSEVRKILIRDKNRLICEKVLENPRVTDSEIESFSKSTNVSEDVLRLIGSNREWSRQPGVMRGLVYNPKTPLGISMGFLKRLSVKDLEFLGKSKNVPEVLRRTARKMHKDKIERRR